MSFSKVQALEINTNAIKLLEKHKRGLELTEEEKNEIRKFSGFGGIKTVLLDIKNTENWKESDLRLKDRVEELEKVLKNIYKEDYEKVRKEINRNTLTGFYTQEKLAKTIAQNIKRATGNNIKNVLEPSCGMGVFISTLVKEEGNIKIDAYEKDILTADLYKIVKGPNVKLHNKGFEEIGKEKENYYDLVISNIPFGNYNVFDLDYLKGKNKEKRESCKKIHNYYFLKSIDKTKDGGIISFITTNATVDTKENESVRKEMLKNTKLISAIKLASNQFEESGTGVGTTLIILQKKEEKRKNETYEMDFIKTEEIEGINENKYIAEKIGEEFNRGNSLYNSIGRGTDLYGKSIRLYKVDNWEDYYKKLGERISNDLRQRFDYNLYNNGKNEIKEEERNEFTGTLFDIKNIYKEEKIENLKDYYEEGVYIKQNNKIGIIKRSEEEDDLVFKPENISYKEKRILENYIEIRDEYFKLIEKEEVQGIESPEIRERLNKKYEKYIKENGYLSSNESVKVISKDVYYKDVIGLEYYDKEEKKWKKSDVLYKPINQKKEEIKNEHDALVASLNNFGKVNIKFIEEKLNKERSEILKNLENEIIYNPINKEYELRDVFLSGEVNEKIEYIKQNYINPDEEVRKSLEELEKVKPKEIPIEDLKLTLGERWIPTEVYEDFVQKLFQLNFKCKIIYRKDTDQYKVQLSEYENTRYNWIINEKYAVKRERRNISAISVLEHAFLDTTPNLTKEVRDINGINTVVDKEATQEAINKIQEIRTLFEKWVVSDSNRYKRALEKMYNQIYNGYVVREYNGDFLKFTDLNYSEKIKELYKSQKDAIWTILCNQGGIVDHVVGGGKTMIMCVAAHEMKRLGIAKKPMIIGMKANVIDIIKTYKEAYPNDKILFTGKDDFDKKNRKNVLNAIRNNDYDCIIITHDNFAKIPQSKRIEKEYLENELEELLKNYETANRSGANKRILSGMQKSIINLQSKISLLEAKMRENKDEIVDFEKMGIDMLFVDESQVFKNLPFTTRNARVGGIGNPQGSQRAANLKMAAMTIQKRRGKEMGLVFLSGTTITNSLSELYLLEKYMRPKELKRKNINSFDAWAEMYAIKTREIEVDVTGRLSLKERFRYFKKVPELAAKYASITHFRNAEMIGIERPELDEKFIMLEPTVDQKEFIKKLIDFVEKEDPSIIERYYDERQMQGKMLIASDLAYKMSIDMRLIDENYEDNPGQKVWKAAEIIKSELESSNEYRGTVLVFCDTSTPKSGSWNIYSDLKQKLVERGVPENEVRFIHEFESEQKKEQIFREVNNGKVRVLIGSTQKMGTGLNIQERVIAMVHLDIPWTPAELEQRIGRGQRKGNWAAKLYRNNKIKNYIIGMKMDAFRLNTVQNKQIFINQIKNSSIKQRVIDDGVYSKETGMSRNEYVAILLGDNDMLEKAKLEKTINELEYSRESFIRNKKRYKEELKKAEKEKDILEAVVEKCRNDNNRINEVKELNQNKEIVNNIKLYDEQAESEKVGERFKKLIENIKETGDYIVIGEIANMKIVAKHENILDNGKYKRTTRVGLKGEQIYLYRGGFLPAANGVENYFRKAVLDIQKTYERNREKLNKINEKIENIIKEVEKKWEKEDYYNEIKMKHKELEQKVKEKLETKKEENVLEANAQNAKNDINMNR